MAKIFRISGFLVTTIDEMDIESMECGLESFLEAGEVWQQLHVEESEVFEEDEEFKTNCDLAFLERHFKKEQKIIFDRTLPKCGDIYRHFKTGEFVGVMGISRNTETNELTVVYDYNGSLWSRPLDMFMSLVDKDKYPESEQEYRFEKVGEW